MATDLSQRVASAEWDRRVAEAIGRLELHEVWSFDVGRSSPTVEEILTTSSTVINLEEANFLSHVGSGTYNSSSGGIDLPSTFFGRKVVITGTLSGAMPTGVRDLVELLCEYRVNGGSWTDCDNGATVYGYPRDATTVEGQYTIPFFGFLDGSSATSGLDFRLRGSIDGVDDVYVYRWSGHARIVE